MSTRLEGPSFILTGQRIDEGVERLQEIHQLARDLCPDGFPAEETCELPALYDHVSIGFIDGLRDQIARKLALPIDVFSRDRFSIHGCGPVGLHDDFFRFPYVYFIVIVAHCGQLGLVDPTCRAQRHQVGDIILLDPRRKHGLIRVGLTAEEHVYEQNHGPVHDPDNQFLFLDFDLRRPDLRSRFRRPSPDAEHASTNV